MTTTTARRIAVPTPRPVPDAERVAHPAPEPVDWAAGYPLLRYAAHHLRVLGERVVDRWARPVT